METAIDIEKIFKNYIKIEPKVMAIETLFNNSRRFDRTNYKPSYQRNYVWADEKATYFIESILLGTEIPPLIFFNSGDKIEVIDGRQRYETIYRFVNNQFKLKSAGLLKLKDLSNKNFDKLADLKDIIWDTKLRIIEFSFHTAPDTDYDVEDIVKKEIFKRYNTGITPLKPTEIDKAKYINDDLNSYIKKALKKDVILFDVIKKIFYSENDNLEAVLKKIRQLLVLHKIPISYYTAKKEEVLTKFYELLSDQIETQENIKYEFDSFIKKINYLTEIKALLDKQKISSNRLIFECLYWALSILENEKIEFQLIDNKNFKETLCQKIKSDLSKYMMDRSSFAQHIFTRYEFTAELFKEFSQVNFSHYLRNHEEFKKLNRALSKNKTTDGDELEKFETLRLNKPDASSNSIDDLCNQMTRQRFMIRPLYQRNEVINKNKSSAIIESLLLGIKLPPIFVFKREDGISEVIDGQQRLLSILGFIGKDYLDENKKLVKSEKNTFSLNLKNGILKGLDKKKFSALTEEERNRILDYDLWMIEINQKNNPHFDQIDLFIRLNYKPYPIKENTFEMWNSYVDRKIIDAIKNISLRNGNWFYLRKTNNSRMENEGLLIYLIYLEYKLSISLKPTFEQISSFLETYKVGDKLAIRIRSKTDIARILESPEVNGNFLKSCLAFEDNFLKKINALVSQENKIDDKQRSMAFDNLMDAERSVRTSQNFYALWLMLSNITVKQVEANKILLLDEIKKIFVIMNNLKSKSQFENELKNIWSRYS